MHAPSTEAMPAQCTPVRSTFAHVAFFECKAPIIARAPTFVTVPYASNNSYQQLRIRNKKENAPAIAHP